MCLMKKILRLILPFPRFESAERVLFVAPHPDDIEVSSGQTAAKLAAAGKTVRFVIALDGRYGSESADTDPEELIKTREAEQRASAAKLGVEDVVFLGFSDGGFYDTEELFAALYREILAFKPDLVFCPDPSLKTECHIDHVNVGNAVKRAFLFASNAPMAKKAGYAAASPALLAMYYRRTQLLLSHGQKVAQAPERGAGMPRLADELHARQKRERRSYKPVYRFQNDQIRIEIVKTGRRRGLQVSHAHTRALLRGKDLDGSGNGGGFHVTQKSVSAERPRKRPFADGLRRLAVQDKIFARRLRFLRCFGRMRSPDLFFFRHCRGKFPLRHRKYVRQRQKRRFRG